MDRATALHILGLTSEATRAEINTAKRTLLAALHPDKHPGSPDVFQRLTRQILEAHRVLTSSDRSPDRRDTSVEHVLFDIRAAESWNRVVSQKGTALAKFDRRYASDRILAVAILGLDPFMSYFTTNGFTGQRADHRGTALYVVAYNRTSTRVTSLDIDHGVLIDDLGNQYSSDGQFYWSDPQGHFHQHSSELAPNAKLDGFILYPPLREGASHFTRWFLADNFSVSGKYLEGEYDVALPQAPQELALAAGQDSSFGDDSLEDDKDHSGSDFDHELLEEDGEDVPTASTACRVNISYKVGDSRAQEVALRLSMALTRVGYLAHPFSSESAYSSGEIRIETARGEEALGLDVQRHLRDLLTQTDSGHIPVTRKVDPAQQRNTVWVLFRI